LSLQHPISEATQAQLALQERVFAIEHDRPDAAFDDAGVELDATVVEETCETVPMVQAVTDLLGDQRLGGDAGKLLPKLGPERRDHRLALVLAHHAPLFGARAADRLLEHDAGQARRAFQSLAKERSRWISAGVTEGKTWRENSTSGSRGESLVNSNVRFDPLAACRAELSAIELRCRFSSLRLGSIAI
jgi:hypothetical protein